MMDISFILGFIGMAVGLIVGIFIFSAVEESIDCPDVGVNPDGSESCARATQLAWVVMGIMPISMFIVIFSAFGGFQNLSFQ
jgi:hypothetical protein